MRMEYISFYIGGESSLSSLVPVVYVCILTCIWMYKWPTTLWRAVLYVGVAGLLLFRAALALVFVSASLSQMMFTLDGAMGSESVLTARWTDKR